MILPEDYVERVSCKPVPTILVTSDTRVSLCAFWVKGVRKWRQESPARWFAPLAALLMVVSLSGCFDKEGDQRKAFIDFLQNTVMRSGERLPTLTADQKNSLVLLSLITRFCMVILSR